MINRDSNIQKVHNESLPPQETPSVKKSGKMESGEKVDIQKASSEEISSTDKVAEKILKSTLEATNSTSKQIPMGSVKKEAPVTAKEFAEKTLVSLKANTDYGPLQVDNKGRLCKEIGGKLIPTGQREDKLKQLLMNQFEMSQKMGSLILVRLKSGETKETTGLQKKGQTHFAVVDPQGNVTKSVKKIENLGTGTFGKAKRLEGERTPIVLKSTYLNKQIKNHIAQGANYISNMFKNFDLEVPKNLSSVPLIKQELENLIKYVDEKIKRDDQENNQDIKLETFLNVKQNLLGFNLFINSVEESQKSAQRDIFNESVKLNEIHKDKIIPGVQLRLEHTVIVVQGEGKGLEVKMGHIGNLYSGNANVLDHEEKVIEDNWTTKEVWTTQAILNGCKDLTEGLADCHKMGIFFGDIKDANILRDDSSQKLFLADLGGAQNIDEIWDEQQDFYVSHTATPATTCNNDLDARYYITNREDYSKLREKMDVFSLGVTLFKLFAKKPITTGYTGGGVSSILSQEEILRALQEQPKSNDVSDQLASLILDMTNLDFDKRITSDEAYKRMKAIK